MSLRVFIASECSAYVVLDRAADEVTEPWEKLEVLCAVAMRYVLDDTDIAAVVHAASLGIFQAKASEAAQGRPRRL
jgi:hypothetical protein